MPQFRSGNFYAGISQGVAAILGLIEGEELPEVTAASSQDETKSPGFLYMFIIFALVFMVGLNAFVKKKAGKWGGMGIMFVVYLVLGWLLVNVILGIFLALIFSVFLNLPGRIGGGRYYGGGFGRSGGGWSSGGGGFGGFSGGGGSFGGGGASGGW